MEDNKAFYLLILVIAIFTVWQYFNHVENMTQIKSEVVESTNSLQQYIANTAQSNNSQQLDKQSINSVNSATCKPCQMQQLQQLQTQQSQQCQQSQQNPNSCYVDNKQINIDVIDPSMPPINPMREYDYRTLYDPLVPPLKRDDYDGFVPSVYTRGYPTGYKKMGLLTDESAPNDDKYKFMILVGRPKYPRGQVYEYFVTENSSESALKFELLNTTKELYTDDTITVSELGKTYKVKVDRNLGFDYSPFLY